MGKYFSIGHFNKYYFFILGSITIRIIIGFMQGFTPYLSPNDTIFLLGFKSNLFSHPLISNCFQYFAIAFGGIILDFIYFKVNKKNYDVNPNENDKCSDNKTENKDVMNSSDAIDSSKLSELNKQLKNKEIKRENYILYLRTIFLLYFFYFFAKISMSSLDNLGYNRVKYWPLEFIFLYYFLRKIIGKKLYKHQLISLSIILIFCTSIYTLNSFFPYTNENCDLVEESKKNECKMLSVNIYKDIINKLGTKFVPIIIIIYFLAMICNAYSAIKNKWFMDFKFITTYKILTYLGIIGLFFSIILLIISSYTPCPKKTIFINYI
jgi:mannose/fructose/N-acetylgalactosamine-specific phosphotransferase system component IIC